MSRKSIAFSSEEWGVIYDGLIQELEKAEARKINNSESTSDVRAKMCIKIMNIISGELMYDDYRIIRRCKVRVRKRPALFSAPHWNEKDEENKARVEEWRNQRAEYLELDIATWQYDYKSQKIIGLLFSNMPSHMAFELDDVLANPRLEHGIHFDAGTSRPELFIEPEEWKRVLGELQE